MARIEHSGVHARQGPALGYRHRERLLATFSSSAPLAGVATSSARLCRQLAGFHIVTAASSMALREFRDSLGRRWRVWDVLPKHLERRHAVLGPPSGQPERRRRFELRSVVAAELRDGWLTFETDRHRRRLAPIPERWELVPEEQLARFCELAETVPFRGRLIE